MSRLWRAPARANSARTYTCEDYGFLLDWRGSNWGAPASHSGEAAITQKRDEMKHENFSNSSPRKPLMVVVSAPSGAGKSTLCARLLAELPWFVYSVSCTTRAPRGQEKNGVAYFFLTQGEFEKRIANGDFLEHALVHGNLYGTLKKTVADSMNAGRSVILDIDVAGAAQIRSAVASLPDGDVMKEGFLDIFISVPSLDVLRHRLEKRGEDSPETIERRLANASGEMARAGEFSRTIVNGELEKAYSELLSTILGKAGE